MLTVEEKTQRKEARKAEREARKEAARIEAERNQKPVKTLTITIEWKKSRTWGSNPRAEAHVVFKDGTSAYKDKYTASGCGYDKESTVIADVFNDFLKYKLYGVLPTDAKYWLNGARTDKPYGVSIKPNWKYYEGGIGTDCYKAISEYIGGKFERTASGKTFDVYQYTDNEEA